MGKRLADGTYEWPLGTANNSIRSYGNVAYMFATFYQDIGQGNSLQTGLINTFVTRGFASSTEGFPAKYAKANPGLVLMQDAFRDLAAPLYSISHQKGGVRNCIASNNGGLFVNVTPNFSDGLGATMTFYDGSARFVPASELVRADNNGNSGYHLWSVMP